MLSQTGRKRHGEEKPRLTARPCELDPPSNDNPATDVAAAIKQPPKHAKGQSNWGVLLLFFSRLSCKEVYGGHHGGFTTSNRFEVQRFDFQQARRPVEPHTQSQTRWFGRGLGPKEVRRFDFQLVALQDSCGSCQGHANPDHGYGLVMSEGKSRHKWMGGSRGVAANKLGLGPGAGSSPKSRSDTTPCGPTSGLGWQAPKTPQACPCHRGRSKRKGKGRPSDCLYLAFLPFGK